MEEEKPQILLWRAPECPYRVTILASVINEIRIVGVEAFYSVPRGGVEIGGIFFGVRDGTKLEIQAHRPIPCQYSTGPSFVLSVKDQLGLSGILDQSAADPDLADMTPLGWYHSHTRSEIFLSPADLQLYSEFFPERWQLAMVLRPANLQPTRAGFFFRDRSGAVKSDAPVNEFTLEPPAFGLELIDIGAPIPDYEPLAPAPVRPAPTRLASVTPIVRTPAPMAERPSARELPTPIRPFAPAAPTARDLTKETLNDRPAAVLARAFNLTPVAPAPPARDLSPEPPAPAPPRAYIPTPAAPTARDFPTEPLNENPAAALARVFNPTPVTPTPPARDLSTDLLPAQPAPPTRAFNPTPVAPTPPARDLSTELLPAQPAPSMRAFNPTPVAPTPPARDLSTEPLPAQPTPPSRAFNHTPVAPAPPARDLSTEPLDERPFAVLAQAFNPTPVAPAPPARDLLSESVPQPSAPAPARELTSEKVPAPAPITATAQPPAPAARPAPAPRPAPIPEPTAAIPPAAEPPRPVDVELPRFLSKPKPKPPRSNRWIWMLAAVIALCVVGTAAVFELTRILRNAGLGLETYDINGAFLIRWDRDSGVLRTAKHVTLEIQDGSEKTAVDLTASDLAVGAYPYMRRTGQVAVLMKVEGPLPAEQQRTFNSAQSLGSQPLGAGAESGLAGALKEKERLKTELINESMQSLELRREITSLRRQLAEERAKNTQ